MGGNAFQHTLDTKLIHIFQINVLSNAAISGACKEVLWGYGLAPPLFAAGPNPDAFFLIISSHPDNSPRRHSGFRIFHGFFSQLPL